MSCTVAVAVEAPDADVDKRTGLPRLSVELLPTMEEEVRHSVMLNSAVLNAEVSSAFTGVPGRCVSCSGVRSSPRASSRSVSGLWRVQVAVTPGYVISASGKRPPPSLVR